MTRRASSELTPLLIAQMDVRHWEANVEEAERCNDPVARKAAYAKFRAAIDRANSEQAKINFAELHRIREAAKPKKVEPPIPPAEFVSASGVEAQMAYDALYGGGAP
jgi:hypothetical protein